MVEMEELRNKVESFEDSIAEALLQLAALAYASVPTDEMVNMLSIADWKLLTFFDKYIEGNVFPADRLDQVMHYLFDIKIQTYFIQHVDMPGYNKLIDLGYDKDDPAKTPHLSLATLSLEQTLIIKSRILWERLMNFVYFLEEGVPLDDAARKNRSKKTFFFKWADNNPRWNWLPAYQPMLNTFDDRLRTPETHKKSTLRGRFSRGEGGDSHEIFTLISVAMTVMQPNILAIISGNDAWVSKGNPDGSGITLSKRSTYRT